MKVRSYLLVRCESEVVGKGSLRKTKDVNFTNVKSQF